MIDLLPDLKNTEIVEVYVYYDRPLLFLCQDPIGRKYIAVLVDEDDDGEYWLYVEVSQRRLEMIRSGGVDLHTAFGRPENGCAFSLRLEFNSEDIFIKPLATVEISQEWLPKKETKLEIPTETLPQRRVNRALSSLREVVGLKLNFVNYTRSEAPAQTLGQVLDSFQEALNNILNTPAWMRVVGFAPGSFEVEMEAEESPDLFNQSKTGYAIKILLELIQAAETPEALQERLKMLRPEAIKSFGNLARSLTGVVDSAEIEWESPAPDDGGKVKISSVQAMAIYEQINQKPEPKRSTIPVKGQLRGLDLKTRHFRITTEKGEEYSGYVLQESIVEPAIQHAQISETYLAVVEELIYAQMTDPNPRPIYSLVKLDHIQSE